MLYKENFPKKKKDRMKIIYSIVFGGITLAAALVAVAGFLTAYVHPQGREWISFPGLILLPVLALNLLLFIGWWWAGSGWKWVPLGAILLNIGFLLSMFHIRIHTDNNIPTDRQIKLITYNVNNFYTDHVTTLAAIAAWTRIENPDIVCFQECPDESFIAMDSIAAAFSFLPYTCSARPASRGPGLAIFSRYPVEWCEPVLYPESSNQSLVAVLNMEGESVRLFNNHLQTTSVNAVKPRLYQARAEGNAQEGTQAAFQMAFTMKRNFVLRADQADYVRQLIDHQSMPVIVCGDFNDTPASYAYHKIKGNLKDGFREAGSGFGYTFRQLRKLFRIDYVFYSPTFKAIRYDSPDLPFSDHKPVVCVLVRREA